MELLVCIINREEHLNAVLSGFAEIGVKGATVVSSEGMAHLIDGDLPVLAGLQTVLAGGRPQNAMVFSLIESPDLLEQAIRLVGDATGGLDEPGAGVLFTLPVSRVVGLDRRAAGESG
jgi:nitrogen regulatory protein P-II 1